MLYLNHDTADCLLNSLRNRLSSQGIQLDGMTRFMTVANIARDVDRDYIMSAEQAVEYGMIDRVVSSRELAPQPVPRRSADSPVSAEQKPAL